MTPFVFDTLSASKQLREAGMSEGVAEAVVSVFQHAATMPDIGHLATKADLDALRVATKSDFELLSAETKAELELLKKDIGAVQSEMATKTDLTKLKAELDVFRAEVRAEFATVRSETSDRMRRQTWTFLGGVAVIITISTAAGRLFG